jgi:glycosyltransferase involved in cell wall biosynthesis
MRIVIDARTISDHFPGIGRNTFELIRALARRLDGEELVLLFNPSLPNTRFDIRSIASGANVRIANTSARPFSLQEQLHLPGVLKKLAPDIMHFPYTVMPYAVQGRIAVSIYDVIPIRLPHYFSLRNRTLYQVTVRLALRSASRILCPSRATMSDLMSAFHLDAARLAIVPGGVSESFHPLAPGQVEPVRTAYSLPEKYVLYVGSNKPHKNLPALIQTYAHLPGAPVLVVAGAEDPRYTNARSLAETLGLTARIRFLGSIPEKDLPALYNGAMAFVFPSKYEGFGLPPVEAMACGVPVACSNIPCLNETVRDAALQFDPGRPESIAAALERIVNDGELRNDLRMRGLGRAAELSWDEAARQALKIYHQM